MTAIKVREALTTAVSEALGIVLAVFHEHIAPLYSPGGAAEFRRYVSPDAQLTRLASDHVLLVAEADQAGILGVAEIRKPSHLSMFFVRTDHQRKGIGRALLNEVVARCAATSPPASELTVHASPNSFNAYRQLGFVPDSPEREQNGIRFVPMHLSIATFSGT